METERLELFECGGLTGTANVVCGVWAQVGDQQTVLMAYFGVCVKRVLDNVCMVIENKLLQAIPDTVMTELVNTLQCRTEVTRRSPCPHHFALVLS
jgi:hypothetical protein